MGDDAGSVSEAPAEPTTAPQAGPAQVGTLLICSSKQRSSSSQNFKRACQACLQAARCRRRAPPLIQRLKALAAGEEARRLPHVAAVRGR